MSIHSDDSICSSPNDRCRYCFKYNPDQRDQYGHLIHIECAEAEKAVDRFEILRSFMISAVFTSLVAPTLTAHLMGLPLCLGIFTTVFFEAVLIGTFYRWRQKYREICKTP